MSDKPTQSIFISHTHTDQAIAHAIRDAVQSLFGDAVAVRYSTNKELEGGIKPGEDWFRWIGQQVREAKVALILLTPASVQKPWVLWEAGAVAGAALASEDAGHRKLRPISYRLKGAEIPTPFGRDHVTDGLGAADIARLFEDLLGQFAGDISSTNLIRRATKLGQACEVYLRDAAAALRIAPLVVTEAAVQEWLERIAVLETEGRFSETDELHDWLNLAFGRDGSAGERPLDMRIHRRLGELYARASNAERAAREFELARQLAPRDVYVLRRLGKAYLDQKRLDDAGGVIKVITELDAKAFVRNGENAALRARWCSARGDSVGAAEGLKIAFDHNPTSYYLGDLLAQTQLAMGQVEDAHKTYAKVLAIIDGLRERNVWVVATGFTAALVLGDRERQTGFLAALDKLVPTAEQAESIRRGVERVAEAAATGPQALAALRTALDQRPAAGGVS